MARKELIRRAKRHEGKAYAKKGAGKRSEILIYYKENCRFPAKHHDGKRQKVVFPERFSFIENPGETLGVLNDMVHKLCSTRTRNIFLNQQKCTLIDHGAESVLAALAIQADTHNKINFSGHFPDDDDVKIIVMATGLPKRLGVEGFPEPPEFLNLGLRHGRKTAAVATQSTQKEKASTDLCIYVNKCLQKYGWELSNEAMAYLADLSGEVLANAEDHSKRDDWWISGYMRHGEDGTYGDCHISFFNFGSTLSESMQSLPPSSKLRHGITELVKQHTKGSFFSPSKWTEDNLWALYSLQQNSSRLNDNDETIGDRGQGTIKMIHFFQEIAGNSEHLHRKPKMCILSGHTHFLFDGKYRTESKNIGGDQIHEIIAFNENNDLSEPPDKNYVRNLKEYFPGTLISIRFYLEQEHLDRLGEDNAND